MKSKEYIYYLNKNKKCNLAILLTQIIMFILLIVSWQISSDLGLINDFIFSSPKKIIDTFLLLHSQNNLYNHIIVTTIETFISFILASFLGLLIASLMWKYKFFAKVLEPYLTILNSLPKISLGPIIIICVGTGMSSIILMALLITVIITILNLYKAFINTDINKVKLMKSLGANSNQIYYKLVLPSNIPEIINVLKINISMSLIGVIMGELLSSTEGIGYLITYGSQVFNLNLVMTGIVILSMLSTLMYFIVILIEKKIKQH